jgi:formamidopyrimidine-DNA glycosylase
MPELPDLAVLADVFHAALTGRAVEEFRVLEPLVVRGTPAETAALRGQPLVGFGRRGKFLILQFERDRVVINAMLTGRLGLAAPGTKPLPNSALVIRFGPRLAAPRPSTVARWTRGATWMPDPAMPIELRYRDPTRMGKVYMLPADLERPVPGFAEQGPDADDPALDREVWRQRIGRHRGELKNVLRDQTFVAGIGNAYSDEILWAARILPTRKRTALAAEEVDALQAATADVLQGAIGELRRRVPPRFEVEVRDFLRVHRKGGLPCPRCGTTISEISPGGFVTSFCRGCQR